MIDEMRAVDEQNTLNVIDLSPKEANRQTKIPTWFPPSSHGYTHHHHHPRLARPGSGQVGSWESVPVALLTFFISERLENIPDTVISALLFLLAVNTP